MDRKQSTPHHASYRRHRSQVAWQVFLPVVIAGVLIVGATVLIGLATFRSNGDVGRWAAISTMWLTIPVMIAGLFILAALIGIAWLLGRAAGFIPPYSYKAQEFASQVEAGVKRGAQYASRPRLLIPEIGHLIRRGFRRLRRG